MPEGALTRINIQEVLLYLGWRGGKPEETLMDSVRQAADTIQKAARPLVIWRRFPVEGNQIPGTSLTLEGQDILRHLEGCKEAILMAATLGPQVENVLMRSGVLDMSQALMMDSCASTAIENVCDNLEAELRASIEKEGFYLTDRFSPGYGDLPLAHQRMLCEVLDTQRRIGLAVSASGIMIPRKSVTAIMGISPVPRKRRSSGCANCNMFYTCQIRKGGGFCGGR